MSKILKEVGIDINTIGNGKNFESVVSSATIPFNIIINKLLEILKLNDPSNKLIDKYSKDFNVVISHQPFVPLHHATDHLIENGHIIEQNDEDGLLGLDIPEEHKENDETMELIDMIRGVFKKLNDSTKRDIWQLLIAMSICAETYKEACQKYDKFAA